MILTSLDWAIIAAYFILSLVIGLFYYCRAGKSTGEYFVAGRNLPWWLAGTSMVATTFAADTPLAVTEMVSRNGVAGNWLWWSMLPSGMLTVFFFARLWRRAEVMTDVEFVELRYSGKPAAVLRGFRSLYLGLAINLIIMGWVNLGMAKILSGTLGLQKWQAPGFCLAITLLYSTPPGPRGGRVHAEVGDDRHERQHPRRGAVRPEREHAWAERLGATHRRDRRDPVLQRIETADRVHGEARQRDRARHRDHELHGVGDDDAPQTREGRGGARDTEPEA